MKLNTNSNVYTIAYSVVMVVIVAFCLAFISDVLRPIQEKNVANDKRSQILAALNLRDVEDVQTKYDEVVLSELIVNINGEVTDTIGGFDVEQKDITAKDPAAKRLPVYVCSVENDTLYVVPLYGRGLWGGLWGYLALKPDFQTVHGAYMSHEGETAGLGARIVEPWFQELFEGKQVYSDTTYTEVALGVKKKVENRDSEVDAITGATLTSNGVDEMFKTSLEPYQQYFQTVRK